MKTTNAPVRIVIGLIALAGASPASLAAVVGRTPGTFAVSPTGAATYTIPIFAPPGPAELQPRIALTYSSQSGIGYVGVGWNVAGLSSIYRCNRTYAQDTEPAPVQLSATDGYCMDGQRLRITGGSYGAAGSTYQTEVANFALVTANGTAGSGPASFTVQGKDGRTYEYGNGGNSQVLAGSTGTASMWLLDKVTDRAGNTMIFTYTTATGSAVPATIAWTPTSAGASTYSYTMAFNYGANVAQSSIYGYIAGTQVANSNLLGSITVSYGGSVVKNYILSYEQSPTTGRERLTQVEECSDAGATNCLLVPTTITYQNGQAGVATTASTVFSGTVQSLQWLYDLNGDGYPDLVYSDGTSVFVAFGSASGFGAPEPTGIAAADFSTVSDLLGNGDDGILATNGGICYFYSWDGNGFQGVTTGVTGCGVLADVNGDGLPDIVTTRQQTVSGEQVFSVISRLNTSSGGRVSFSQSVNTRQVYDCLNCSSFTLYSPPAGALRYWDFDGDGRQDLATTWLTVINNNYTMHYDELLSDGTNFSRKPLGQSTGLPLPESPMFVNWNNDACTDAVWNAAVYISGCNGTAAAALSVPGRVLTTMDWDGDGRTDVLVDNGGTVGVYLSTGTGLSTLQSTSLSSAGCGFFAFDANGDGLTDLGCQGSGVSYFAHSGAGQPPDLLSSVTDGYGNQASPSYVSVVQSNYTKGGSGAYPDPDWIGPLPLCQCELEHLPSGIYSPR